jgi:hypothetical protein
MSVPSDATATSSPKVHRLQHPAAVHPETLLGFSSAEPNTTVRLQNPSTAKGPSLPAGPQGNGGPEPQPQLSAAPSIRGDSGHISFGGIVQSPSVETVAANIEAVGATSGLRVPDLIRVGLEPCLLQCSLSHSTCL